MIEESMGAPDALNPEEQATYWKRRYLATLARLQDVHASAAPAAAPLPVRYGTIAERAEQGLRDGWWAAAPLPQDERERHTIALVEIAAIHLGNAQARGDREQMKFWRGVLTQHKSRAALSAASPAAPIQPMNTDDGHLVSAVPTQASTTPPSELQRIHAVVMNVAGDWPDDERDPYTLRHVKWMARELQKRKA